ncbi:hypothetical protein QR98_0104900 [Sarcoptes scabiei]|uniref:RRM domain-containing protein n=1 Tax=Sarcoptes scabiei TaxID=52283 RepID=A0A132ALR9_SARSC|nr:hypothetical protein QR98_0104900 [Sarcoptes scabiei]
MENEEDVLQLLIQDHQDYDDLEFEIDDEAEAKLLEDVPETNPIESDKTLKDKNDRVDNVDHDVNDDSKQTNNVADNNVRSRNDHKPKRPSKNFQNRNHSMMNRSQNRIRNEIRGFHSRRHQNQRPNMEQFNLNPSMYNFNPSHYNHPQPYPFRQNFNHFDNNPSPVHPVPQIFDDYLNHGPIPFINPSIHPRQASPYLSVPPDFHLRSQPVSHLNYTESILRPPTIFPINPAADLHRLPPRLLPPSPRSDVLPAIFSPRDPFNSHPIRHQSSPLLGPPFQILNSHSFVEKQKKCLLPLPNDFHQGSLMTNDFEINKPNNFRPRLQPPNVSNLNSHDVASQSKQHEQYSQPQKRSPPSKNGCRMPKNGRLNSKKIIPSENLATKSLLKSNQQSPKHNQSLVRNLISFRSEPNSNISSEKNSNSVTSPTKLNDRETNIDNVNASLEIDELYLLKLKEQQKLREKIVQNKAEKRKLFASVCNNELQSKPKDPTDAIIDTKKFEKISSENEIKSPTKSFPSVSMMILTASTDSNQSLNANNCMIKIANLGPNVRESSIRKITRPFGMVESIRFQTESISDQQKPTKQLRSAIVVFTLKQNAQKFLDHLAKEKNENSEIFKTLMNWLKVTFFGIN